MTSETKVAMIGYEDAKVAADSYRDATTKIEKIETQIRNEQAKIASKYEYELNEAKAEQAAQAATLENYLGQNKDVLLQGNARSFMLSGVTLGYRKAKAKLVTVGKNSWDKVMLKLTAAPIMFDQFVKTKEEIDKTALAKADAEVLKELGLKLEQEDTFYAKL